MLQKNLDRKGRLFRLAIALLLFIYAVWQGSWLALGFSIFTAIEAAASWCVFYQLMGWNSCPLNKKR